VLDDVDARKPMSQPVLCLRARAGARLVFTDEQDRRETRLSRRCHFPSDLLVGFSGGAPLAVPDQHILRPAGQHHR
jgi:hypothetical protein